MGCAISDRFGSSSLVEVLVSSLGRYGAQLFRTKQDAAGKEHGMEREKEREKAASSCREKVNPGKMRECCAPEG